MDEENNNIICLTDDDGTREIYMLLDIVEYDGCEYAVLYPEEGEEGVVEIMRLEDLNDEEDAYIPVGSEEILNTVFELFKERNNDGLE